MNEHRRVAVAIGLGVSFGVVLLAWVLASCGGGSALRVIAIEDRTGGAHIDSGALGRADAYARAQVGYAGDYFAHFAPLDGASPTPDDGTTVFTTRWVFPGRVLGLPHSAWHRRCNAGLRKGFRMLLRNGAEIHE